MARKVAKPVEAPAPDTGADDLATMHRDATETIGGRAVTFHAYRFWPGQQVRAKAKPLIRDLKTQIESGSALFEEILDVLAVHTELVRWLILAAIPAAAEPAARAEWEAWIAGLDDEDAELLLFVWWGVCGPFFLKMIVRRWQQQRQLKEDLAATQGGPTSTHASPPPATAPLSSSDTNTRSGS